MMIRLARTLAALALIGVTTPALAEMTVGIVDLRAALLSSDNARKFGEELKKDYADDEKRLRDLGDQAKTLQDRLQKDGPIMSESERNKLSAELEDKAQEFNFLKNKYQSAIAKREETFVQRSKPDIDKALEKIAKEKSLQLILPANLAVYADKSLDVTQQLIDALNK